MKVRKVICRGEPAQHRTGNSSRVCRCHGFGWLLLAFLNVCFVGSFISDTFRLFLILVIRDYFLFAIYLHNRDWSKSIWQKYILLLLMIASVTGQTTATLNFLGWTSGASLIPDSIRRNITSYFNQIITKNLEKPVWQWIKVLFSMVIYTIFLISSLNKEKYKDLQCTASSYLFHFLWSFPVYYSVIMHSAKMNSVRSCLLCMHDLTIHWIHIFIYWLNMHDRYKVKADKIWSTPQPGTVA